LNERGEEEKLKARITPKGFMQTRGVDYFEIFAPTVRYKTIRIVMSLVAMWDLELHGMDAISAFLNAEVKEDVFIEIPEGYGVPDDPRGDYVLKLYKALYGIHQAPREWYLLVRDFIVNQLKFTQCTTDSCLFFKTSRTGQLMLLVMFVDDFQSAFHREDLDEWLQLKKIFMAKFKITDLGESTLMLGMRITRDRKLRTLVLDQEVYVEKMLEKFEMQSCKDIATPEAVGSEAETDEGEDASIDAKIYMQLVGALLYATLSTRPDIAHAVHQLTKHTQQPKQKHWIAAKRVLRYLRGTAGVALKFGAGESAVTSGGEEEMVVSGYSDADWANDIRDRKSVSGWVVKLNGDVVNWSCKKQQTTALSTCEAELYAESACVQEVLWLRHLLEEIGLRLRPQSVVWGDNQSTLQISEDGIIRERTKHVDIKHKFITENIECNAIKVSYIRSEDQQADILTKALQKPIFVKHRESLMTR